MCLRIGGSQAHRSKLCSIIDERVTAPGEIGFGDIVCIFKSDGREFHLPAAEEIGKIPFSVGSGDDANARTVQVVHRFDARSRLHHESLAVIEIGRNEINPKLRVTA